MTRQQRRKAERQATRETAKKEILQAEAKPTLREQERNLRSSVAKFLAKQTFSPSIVVLSTGKTLTRKELNDKCLRIESKPFNES